MGFRKQWRVFCKAGDGFLVGSEGGIMEYREDKKGNKISALGFGCMRFTRKGSSIDLDKAEKEVMEAIASGVNYLDTAYL